MRIIHDIDGPAKIIVSAQVYTKRTTEALAHGMNVDLSLFVPSGKGQIEEEVNLQGNAKHILAALKEAVSIIEMVGDDFVKAGTLRPDWKTFQRPKAAPKKRAASKSAKKKV